MLHLRTNKPRSDMSVARLMSGNCGDGGDPAVRRLFFYSRNAFKEEPQMMEAFGFVVKN
jgi:hypothetical protein